MRTHEVDVIRLAALIGICIVNAPFMGLPAEAVFAPPDEWHNRAAAFVVECFFQLKFFTLFSFIFGWGLAIQASVAAAKGQPLQQRYFRRLAGLAILGVLHALLVFSGDILVLYAILGSLLWLLRDSSTKVLTTVALSMIPLSMIPLSIVCLTLLAVIIDTIDLPTVASVSPHAGLGGSYLDTIHYRLADWPGTFAFLWLLQGPLAFGAFLIGLAAAKSNFF